MRLFTFLDYLFTGVLLLAVVLCSLAMGGCVSSDKSVTYESITFPETVTVDVSGLEKPAGVSEAVLAQHLHACVTGALRSPADEARAGPCADDARSRRMVRMRVGHDHGAEPGCFGEDRRRVAVDDRPGIDYDRTVLAEDVGVRARPRHHRRVRRHDAPDARRHLARNAGSQRVAHDRQPR